MSELIIISDSENEKLRPLLLTLAKRNQSLPEKYKSALDQKYWAVSLGNYEDRFLSTLCLVCGETLISKNLVLETHVYEVRYHGFCHLKDKGLHIFL